MMGRSHRCYIQSFVEIDPLVPEKIFYHILTWRPSWSEGSGELKRHLIIYSTSKKPRHEKGVVVFLPYEGEDQLSSI